MSCFSFIFKGRKSKLEHTIITDEEVPGIEMIKIYSYKELRCATDDFNPTNKIGEGGFGSVYKGKLKDGKFAAIKVLSSESKQGAREFLSELKTIANVVHENLVDLYGCCVEGNNRILVYSYFENNSLLHTLLGGRSSNLQFNWRTRTKICIGVARGLAFLHEVVKPHIVHRDIKASNVLLDKDLNPKISDFGLAKLFPPDATHVSTRVAGTIGYLAPEYAVGGKLTRKADVYSFGILLLEIVSGRCNTNKRLPTGEQFLIERAWKLHERNEIVMIVDPDLNGDFDAEEACRVLRISLLCTQDAMKLRPSMSNVVEMLTGKISVNLGTITRPGLISDITDIHIRTQEKSCSVSLADTDNSSDNNTTSAYSTFNAICEQDDCSVKTA